MKQLILSGIIKSVCLENNNPIECNQFLALGNCEKCNHFNKQADVSSSFGKLIPPPPSPPQNRYLKEGAEPPKPENYI